MPTHVPREAPWPRHGTPQGCTIIDCRGCTTMTFHSSSPMDWCGAGHHSTATTSTKAMEAPRQRDGTSHDPAMRKAHGNAIGALKAGHGSRGHENARQCHEHPSYCHGVAMREHVSTMKAHGVPWQAMGIAVTHQVKIKYCRSVSLPSLPSTRS